MDGVKLENLDGNNGILYTQNLKKSHKSYDEICVFRIFRLTTKDNLYSFLMIEYFLFQYPQHITLLSSDVNIK